MHCFKNDPFTSEHFKIHSVTFLAIILSFVWLIVRPASLKINYFSSHFPRYEFASKNRLMVDCEIIKSMTGIDNYHALQSPLDRDMAAVYYRAQLQCVNRKLAESSAVRV